MPVPIPESHKDLLNKPAFANLATLNADGSPQVTPVWVDWDGTNLLVENGADAHIDKMAKKYLGKDSYPFRTPTEVRVIATIAIDKVHVVG